MRSLLTGMDVGTGKVCMLIAGIASAGRIVVLGYGIAPCSGLRCGVVVKIEATVEALHTAVSEAQKSAGIGVGVAVVGISATHIHGLNTLMMLREMADGDGSARVQPAGLLISFV